MLRTIAIVLIVLWAVGLLASYTMGGLIHLLAALALVAILFHIIQGRADQYNPRREGADDPRLGQEAEPRKGSQTRTACSKALATGVH